MDLKNVKGYKRLTKGQQELLERVYEKHMREVEDESKWEIKSVIWERSYLRVSFKNGEWLHYSINGNWY